MRISKLTVPVKYVRNDNMNPFSRVDRTEALINMPGIRRSIEMPLRSLVCIRKQPKEECQVRVNKRETN